MPRSFDTPLPIDAVLDKVARALAADNAAVLVAPPGAGKTTRVPLALLDEPWLAGQKIMMLEPRRLAARAAARGWPDAGRAGGRNRRLPGALDTKGRAARRGSRW